MIKSQHQWLLTEHVCYSVQACSETGLQAYFFPKRRLLVIINLEMVTVKKRFAPPPPPQRKIKLKKINKPSSTGGHYILY